MTSEEFLSEYDLQDMLAELERLRAEQKQASDDRRAEILDRVFEIRDAAENHLRRMKRAHLRLVI